MLRPVANSSPCLFSDQMSEAEREALDDQQQQQGQQGLNLKGKKKCLNNLTSFSLSRVFLPKGGRKKRVEKYVGYYSFKLVKMLKFRDSEKATKN